MLSNIKQQLPKLLFPLIVGSGVAFISSTLSQHYSFVLPHKPPPYLQQQKADARETLDEANMQEIATQLNEIEPQAR